MTFQYKTQLDAIQTLNTTTQHNRRVRARSRTRPFHGVGVVVGVDVVCSLLIFVCVFR
jgi:hypothetical protein